MKKAPAWRDRKTEVYRTPLGLTVFTERERHAKGKAGRPTVITPLAISKLKEAWSIGSTDAEACLFAGIGASTLVTYFQKNPALANERDALKQLPVFQSRRNVTDAIRERDIAVSQWYLERKAREEFAKTPEIAAVSLDLSKLLEEVERREAKEMEVPASVTIAPPAETIL